MKTIILLRHAKSSWKDSSLQDLDRPLNRRGKANALMMGERLFVRGYIPSVIFSSPATRARETAGLIVEAFGVSQHVIKLIPDLYTFNYEELLGWIRCLDKESDNLLITSHNPAITDLVNFLTLSHIDKIPTCGVVVLKLAIRSWGQLGAGMAEVEFYDYPKNDGQAMNKFSAN